jgi:hypothetical protein
MAHDCLTTRKIDNAPRRALPGVHVRGPQPYARLPQSAQARKYRHDHRKPKTEGRQTPHRGGARSGSASHSTRSRAQTKLVRKLPGQGQTAGRWAPISQTLKGRSVSLGRRSGVAQSARPLFDLGRLASICALACYGVAKAIHHQTSPNTFVYLHTSRLGRNIILHIACIR